MKKSLFAGAASLLLAAMPVFGAYAIDSQSHDVTVGDVEEPVYSVDINWGDLSFDWKYDEDNGDHDFKATLGCRPLKSDNIYNSGFSGADMADFLPAARNLGLVYSDDTCSTVYYGDIEGGGTIYYSRVEAKNLVTVLDYSTNGAVDASLSFTAESDYDWVVGKTANIAAVTPDGKINYYAYSADVPENAIWPAMGTSGGPGGPTGIPWLGYFYVEKAPNADLAGKTISANDKIGTLTINLTPAGE